MGIQTLPAKIERVFAAKPTWSAGRATGLEEGNSFSFSGAFCARVGDELFLTGEWVSDPKWGRQFKVAETARFDGKEDDPFNEDALVNYLASNKDFAHVGPARARMLVETFGGIDELSEALLERPHEIVALVPGLTDERVRVFAAQWALEYYLHKYRVELTALGLTQLQAKRAIDALGPHAAAVLKTHPLDLWLVCPELGFDRVEQVAFRAGIVRGSVEHKAVRTLAAVAQLSAKEGHTFVRVSKSGHAAALEYSREHKRFRDAAAVSLTDPWMGIARYVSAEETVRSFCAHAHSEGLFWAARPGSRPAAPKELSEEQRIAFCLMLRRRGVLVLGGAGTGKTFLANHVADAFENAGANVEFCAPTGKAAKRLTETTGRPASTIHRLLGARGGKGPEVAFSDDKIDADLLVVDELSMCDSALLGALLERLEPRTSVLLMGDPQQLPPVAPGYPLRDIISKNLMPAVKLMQVHRQGGPLKAACCGILEGECAEETSPVWYPRNVTTKNYLDTILDVLDALDEEGFDSLEDVQVLTPFRKTRDELNKALQAFYNEENLAGRRGDDEILTIGDKVMQERNDYELGVFNGEVGVVEDEIPETSLTVRFDDRRVVYSFDARDNFGARRNPQRNLRLAYAMTVHKSQGSEYPIVIVAVPTLPDEKSLARNLLHRNMLYTAVTRARERVYLLTGRGALRHMLATLSMDERTTYLSQLREETGQS